MAEVPAEKGGQTGQINGLYHHPAIALRKHVSAYSSESFYGIESTSGDIVFKQ